MLRASACSGGIFHKFFIRVNITLYKYCFLVYINVVGHGGVAQLGERTVRIRKVESSILFVSTKLKTAQLLGNPVTARFLLLLKAAENIKKRHKKA